jgi:hypothetical protein
VIYVIHVHDAHDRVRVYVEERMSAQAHESMGALRLLGKPSTRDEAVSNTLEAIRTSHAGRRPTWRALAATRIDDWIYELALWRSSRSTLRYCVLVWSLSDANVRWQSFATLAQADAFLRGRKPWLSLRRRPCRH